MQLTRVKGQCKVSVAWPRLFCKNPRTYLVNNGIFNIFC